MIEYIIGLLQQNEFLLAGVGTTAASWLLYQLRSLPAFVWGHLRYQLTTTVDIADRETAYRWVRLWLSVQKEKQRHLSLTMLPDRNNGREGPQVAYNMAPGRHLVWWGKRPLLVNIVRIQKENSQQGGFNETLYLTTLGRNTAVWQRMTDAAKTLYQNVHQGSRVPINLVKTWGWQAATLLPRRSLASVVLPKGVAERVLTDAKEFLAARDWYEGRGIPYRRGYLFHGLPGTGKTSLVLALASELNLPISVLELSSLEDDSELLECMRHARGIMLLEDVDRLMNRIEDETPSITMSGLLNALDGFLAAEGVITILTTNHRDRLDDALIRPGRVDLEVAFDVATPRQLIHMFEMFYGEPLPAGSYTPLTPAEAQSIFLQHKGCPQTAVVALMAQNPEGEPVATP